MANRNYSTKVIKKLYARSGNQCSMYECTRQLFGFECEHNSSEIAHIESLNSKEIRYNPFLSEEELNGYENLILLCPNHHTEIDAIENKETYTVKYLTEMKQAHEQKVYNEVVSSMKPPVYFNCGIQSEIIDIYWDRTPLSFGEINEGDVDESLNKIIHQNQLTIFVLYNIILNAEIGQDDINMVHALNTINNIADEEKANQIMILEKLGILEEVRFTGYSDNTLFECDDGGLTYYGENVWVKFRQGYWQFTKCGKIIYCFYYYFNKDKSKLFDLLIRKALPDK